MKTHIYLIVSLLIGLCLHQTAQNMAVPISFQHSNLYNLSFRASLSNHTLPNYDNQILVSYADSILNSCNICEKKSYYGKGNRNQINIKSTAQYYNFSIDGGKLWIFKISSPTALGLQLYFSKFLLPDRSNLYVYTADKQYILGPFTSYNNPHDSTMPIQFGTQPLPSNEIYVEYFQHDSADFDGQIIIDNIIHVFNTSPLVSYSGVANASRSNSGPFGIEPALCEKDVACTVGWEKEINSSALIEIYDINVDLNSTCSGVLLNNTSGNGEPYFLTAGHCFDENNNLLYDASSWGFAFDYQNNYCANNNNVFNVPHQWVYGATILKKDPQPINSQTSTGYSTLPLTSDYMLLKLNATAIDIQQLGICYAGWSIQDPLQPFYSYPALKHAFFHNPWGSIKKATYGNNLAQVSLNATGFTSSDYLTMDYTYGTAEPGSSGAGLFNYNHKIIGQYFGRTTTSSAIIDVCDYSTFYPLFGKFKSSWLIGQFQQYLDPLNLTNNPNYDGPNSYCPYAPGTTVGIGGPVSSSNFQPQDLSHGFKINGKAGTPVLCPNSYMTITPLLGDQFMVNSYFRATSCDEADDLAFGGWQFGCGGKQFIWKYNCYCSYYSYEIDLEELDYNLNSTGISGSVVRNKKVYQTTISMLGTGLFNSETINLNDFGIQVKEGHYYKVGFQTSSGGVWKYSSRFIYILPSDLYINNSNIQNNVYAINSITLEDCSIPGNFNNDFSATTYIKIKPNSSLKSGRYFLENINCGTFRLSNNNSINSSNSSHSSSTSNYTYYDKIEIEPSINNTQIKPTINISPNPSNNGLFKIMDNTQKIRKIEIYNNLQVLVATLSNTFDIDLSNFPAGIYYAYITTQYNTYYEKLIYNK